MFLPFGKLISLKRAMELMVRTNRVEQRWATSLRNIPQYHFCLPSLSHCVSLDYFIISIPCSSHPHREFFFLLFPCVIPCAWYGCMNAAPDSKSMEQSSLWESAAESLQFEAVMTCDEHFYALTTAAIRYVHCADATLGHHKNVRETLCVRTWNARAMRKNIENI